MINKILKKIGLTSKITRQKLELFIQKYKSDGLTLDIGCSNSPYIKYFPNRVGLDIQDGPNVDIVADIHKLPFEDEKFDNILCTEVLEHLHSPHIAIAEMKRVLKPGGKLILSTRFIFPLHEVPNDYYRYTKYGLKYLFKDWQIIELKEEANTLTTLAVLLQRIGYQCEILGFRPFKILFFIKAKIISWFSFLITKEYGDIRKKQPETNIMASGYYLVSQKI
ncbi:class I SAM-dependent methyltransferase [Patescibacteria group bacterium]|nr:class I SAM-dependent methyltransferase [Patescibacteria group bacterium]MBU2472965.1 class I SAM-dependent methyltransferase [Patescibacteria group bacterium]